MSARTPERAAEIIHAQVHYDTPPEVTSCMTCHDAVDSLKGHGALATPTHDAAVAAKALRGAAKIMRANWDVGGKVRDLDDPATSHSADTWLEIMAGHVDAKASALHEGGESDA